MSEFNQTQFMVSICKHPDLSMEKAGTYAPNVDLPVGTEVICNGNLGWPLLDQGDEEVFIDILRDKEATNTPVLLIFNGGIFDYHSFEKLSSDVPLQDGHPYVVAASQHTRYEKRILHMFEMFQQDVRRKFLGFKNVIGIIIILKHRGPGVRNDVDTIHVIQREKTRRDIVRLKKATKAMKLDRRLQQHLARLSNDKFVETLAKKMKAEHVERLQTEYISVFKASRDPDAEPMTADEEAKLLKDAKKFAESDAMRIAQDEAIVEARRLMNQVRDDLGAQMAEEFPEYEKEYIEFQDEDMSQLIGFTKTDRAVVLPLGAGVVLNHNPSPKAIYRGTLFKSLDFNRMIPGQAALYERRQRGMDVVVNAGGAFSNSYYMIAEPNSQVQYAPCEAIEIGANYDRAKLRARDYKNIASGIYVGRVKRGGRLSGQAYLIQPGDDGIKHTVIGRKIYSATTPTALRTFKQLCLPLGQTVDSPDESDGNECNGEHCNHCE